MDPWRWRIIRLPWIIITNVSIYHQLQGDCISSWLVPTLAGFSQCHLAPASCPPSCCVTSTHSKQLRGTNSEKPEFWVTHGRETSELTAMNTQSRAILLGNKTHQWPTVCHCVLIDPDCLCTGLHTWTQVFIVVGTRYIAWIFDILFNELVAVNLCFIVPVFLVRSFFHSVLSWKDPPCCECDHKTAACYSTQSSV